MRTLSLIFCLLLIFSCDNRKGYAPERELKKFDRKAWDEMVKQGNVIYKSEKRKDGSLESEIYFFGDTASFMVEYDDKSRVNTVTHRNAQQLATWVEFYFPHGARKSRFLLKSNPMTGAEYDGQFEEYFETGKLRSTGLYKNDKLLWEAPFEKNGEPRDTVVYE